MLLTVSKLKNLVGEENVGVPVLVNQRLARPFALDADAMPNVTAGNTAPLAAGAGSAGMTKISFQAEKSSASRSGTLADEGIGVPGINTHLALVTTEKQSHSEPPAIIGFDHFTPPLRAEVLVRDRRLVYIRTHIFAGHVTNLSGVWKGNSHWWNKPWKTQEWDIEIENGGVYRLCKANDEWVLTGEYD